MDHRTPISPVRRALAHLEDIWTHELWLDQAIELHLSAEAGAQLTPEEEVMAWIGEAVVGVLEER